MCFSKDWPQYKFAKKNNKSIFLINPTRASRGWLDTCTKQAKIIVKEHPLWLKKNYKPEKTILFILGYLGKFPQIHSKETGESLFRETIKVLLTETDFLILLKPHAITDVQKIQTILSEYKTDRAIIIYNHIAIISKFCNLAICNYNSLSLPDVWYNGVKTIEYTCYEKRILNKTNFNSIVPKYVDVFINKNYEKLVAELKKKY